VFVTKLIITAISEQNYDYVAKPFYNN